MNEVFSNRKLTKLMLSALFIAVLNCQACAASSTSSILSMDPAIISAGEECPRPEKTSAGLKLKLPFSKPVERAYWDFPVTEMAANTRVLAIDIDIPDPASIRALTVHLRNGKDWLSAPVSLSGRNTQRLIIQQQDFRPESGSPKWEQADMLRIAAWPGSARDTAIVISKIEFLTPPVAVIGPDNGAPGNTSWQHTERAVRLLRAAGIDAAVIPDTRPPRLDSSFKLIVLPHNPSLSENTLNALGSFVRERSGKLAVFYQSDSRLAELLGVAPRRYTTREQYWRTVSFDTNSIPGLPDFMPHPTQHLIPVSALKNGQTTGYWMSAGGTADRLLPAAAQTPSGLWFSHTPPLPSSMSVQWLLASLSAMDSEYTALLKKHLNDYRVRTAEASGVLATVTAPTNEIRGVWSRWLGSQNRTITYRKLSRLGINAVFEEVAAGGYLIGSTEVPADEAAADKPFRQVEPAVKTARENNIRFHAWISTFNIQSLKKEQQDRLSQQGRLMKDNSGGNLPWLCPSHPENRKLILHLIRRLKAGGVDGIHLDYIRYPGQIGCYCPVSRRTFEAKRAGKVTQWPADVISGGPLHREYRTFLSAEITSFAGEVRDVLKQSRSTCILTAAVFPTVESAEENAQDWPAWCRDGLVDYVCPMFYTETTAQFSDWLEKSKAAAASRRIIPGIGSLSDISSLDTLDTAMQIKTARQHGAAGFVLFDLNVELTERTLPALNLNP